MLSAVSLERNCFGSPVGEQCQPPLCVNIQLPVLCSLVVPVPLRPGEVTTNTCGCREGRREALAGERCELGIV